VLDTPLVTITGQLSVTGTRGTGSSVATIQGDVHVNGEVWGKFSTAPVSLTQHIHHAVNTPPAIGTRAAEEPPVITGSYGDIPALKNLLQFLQSRGDIVDNST
jgi:hypothetical protein